MKSGGSRGAREFRGMFNLIFIILGGALIGWLGKKVARDDIRIPTWLTIACGIGGMFVGSALYFVFFDHNGGIEWWRHAWQVVVGRSWSPWSTTTAARTAFASERGR